MQMGKIKSRISRNSRVLDFQPISRYISMMRCKLITKLPRKPNRKSYEVDRTVPYSMTGVTLDYPNNLILNEARNIKFGTSMEHRILFQR